LNWIESLLAQVSQVTPPTTAPTTQRAPGWYQFIVNFGPLLLLGVLFYFLMFGNKRKQEKQRQDMLSQLSKGTEVVTIGGQIGKVVEARPDRVLLKVDESSNTKIWFLRSAIHRVLDDEKDKAESK